MTFDIRTPSLQAQQSLTLAENKFEEGFTAKTSFKSDHPCLIKSVKGTHVTLGTVTVAVGWGSSYTNSANPCYTTAYASVFYFLFI